MPEGTQARYLTDKMPSNYYFAGLIHLALPNARIVHTVRDPVDTCISCFSKLFTAEQNHTYDLGELGRYYARYERLMAHWRRVLFRDDSTGAIDLAIDWRVLAAINRIETNFGQNTHVSSAGAVGWMQFLPSTWRRWGTDASGDGIADPYDPQDAIFSAARYLDAAGAQSDIRRAVFAYNHADWYVNDVLRMAAALPENYGS